jgi:drug/metabolite transporter (DMT)-like permease
MLSIVAGFITAVIFAVGMIAAARASRSIGAVQVVAVSSSIGLVIVVPWCLISGIPTLDGGQLALMVLAGIVNVLGFRCTYAALRFGKVGLVAPIVAAEGAVAAIISAFLGQSIAPLVAFLLVVITGGIVIAARSQDPAPFDHERPLKAAGLATLGAISFGISLFAVGILSAQVSLPWVLLPGRVVGVFAIALPLLAMSRLSVPRSAWPILVLLACCDLAGIAAYSVGAQENLAVTAVISSQMAPIAAVMAFFLFRERMGRGQITGLVVIVIGMSVLGVVQ